MIIQTRRKRRAGTSFEVFTLKDSRYEWTEVFEAHIAMMPKIQAAWITIKLQQRLIYQGYSLQRPILNVSAVIPNDAEVYDVIRRNDVNGLINLLHSRRAALSDRDSDGRCLLNASLSNPGEYFFRSTADRIGIACSIPYRS